MLGQPPSIFFFFFNDTATTEIYTLSLHDALPISAGSNLFQDPRIFDNDPAPRGQRDRKSTRLSSSHGYISYAVFCLKKKKKNQSRPATSSQKSTGSSRTSTSIPTHSKAILNSPLR